MQKSEAGAWTKEIFKHWQRRGPQPTAFMLLAKASSTAPEAAAPIPVYLAPSRLGRKIIIVGCSNYACACNLLTSNNVRSLIMERPPQRRLSYPLNVLTPPLLKAEIFRFWRISQRMQISHKGLNLASFPFASWYS